MSPIYTPGKLTLKKDPVLADPYYNDVSLLLHGDLVTTSTNIVDSSPSAKTATLVGDVQISTAESKFGGSSIVFDKTADRITYSSSDFAFGTGNFTIETWMYSRDVGDRGILQISPTAGGLAVNSIGGILINSGFPNLGRLYVGGPIGTGFSASAVLTVNQWDHLAVSRSGSTLRAFVNGNQVISFNDAGNITGTNLVVGGYFFTSYLYDGYLDEVRITKGIARYETGTGANAGKMVFAGTNTLALPTAPFPEVVG